MIDYLLENEYKNSNEGEKSASSLESGTIPHCLPSSPNIQAALISPISKKSGLGSLSFGFNYTKMLNKTL
ncbi:rCG63026 [Rattus norvegicus]|uniref:RCG63026 n=1 Tax=Rattus norvegicus TaxID=10116 RepID=A6JE70_RAT|nr:rCG63026 [Rattus norvegicus]